MTSTMRTTAVFLQPFELEGFDEVLPAGEYQIETELIDRVDWIEPDTWASSVLVHLHPRASHPGLSRTLTVPLNDLEHAIAQDKLTGKALKDYFLEELLSDPMICLVMRADGVTDEEIRRLYAGRRSNDGRRHPTPVAAVGTTEDGPHRPLPRTGVTHPEIEK